MAYQGFGPEESKQTYQILCFEKFVGPCFARFFPKKLKIHYLWTKIVPDCSGQGYIESLVLFGAFRRLKTLILGFYFASELSPFRCF